MEIINEFPDMNTNKYDWETIFDGKIRALEKGVDFKIDIASMRSAVASAANRRKIQVKMAQRKDYLYIQAIRND